MYRDAQEVITPRQFIESLEAVDEIGEVAVAPGQVLLVMPGQSVRVTATVDYMGPALDDTFYAAIGARHPVTGFAEWFVKQVPIHFNPSTNWVTYTLSADIPIPSTQSPTMADIYVKIAGHLEAGLPEYDGVIQIGVAAAFRNFKITDYSKV